MYTLCRWKMIAIIKQAPKDCQFEVHLFKYQLYQNLLALHQLCIKKNSSPSRSRCPLYLLHGVHISLNIHAFCNSVQLERSSKDTCKKYGRLHPDVCFRLWSIIVIVIGIKIILDVCNLSPSTTINLTCLATYTRFAVLYKYYSNNCLPWSIYIIHACINCNTAA